MLIYYLKRPKKIVEKKLDGGLVERTVGVPYGVVVAELVNVSDIGYHGEIKYGWAMCGPKDRFSKKKARQIALWRMEHGTEPWVTIPDDILVELDHMKMRAERYYKVASHVN